MNHKSSLILILAYLIPGFLVAQSADEFIRSGNEFYMQKKYEEAKVEYEKALEMEPSNTTAKFNLANAIYRAGRPQEAEVHFSDISSREKDSLFRAKAFYNDGVMMTKQQKLEASIESYKNALRQDPNDKETRENLQKALIELKKRNPPKEEEQKPKKDQKKPQQSRSKMNQKEAEQKLKLLQQKEKEVQQRLQKQNAKSGGALPKDW